MSALRTVLAVSGVSMAAAFSAFAAVLDQAEVTRIYNAVELLPSGAAAIPAKVGDEIGGKTAVQTREKSRAELLFNDQTIARLGANSIFSFEKGTRDLNLKEGVILLQVPKDAGGATVNTAAVSAAVTGTTVMIEFRQALGAVKGIVKFIVLEGTMRLRLKGRLGESVLVRAGQILAVSSDAKSLGEPVSIDMGRLIKTSGLMSDQFGELNNMPYILDTVREQRVLKSKGKLINLNYGLYGKDRNPVLSSSNTANQASIRTAAEFSPARIAANRSPNANRPSVTGPRAGSVRPAATTPRRPPSPPRTNSNIPPLPPPPIPPGPQPPPPPQPPPGSGS